MMLPSEESLMVCRDYMLENWIPDHYEDTFFLSGFFDYEGDKLLAEILPHYMHHNNTGRWYYPKFSKKQAEIIESFIGENTISNPTFWRAKDLTLVNWID